MKLINYIKNMDRTKRYVILFVLISFISILGVGCYNSFNKIETKSSKNLDITIAYASKKTEKEINHLKKVCQNNESINIIKSENETLENNTAEINNSEGDKKNNSKDKISSNITTNKNSTSNNSSTNNTQSKTDTAASNTDKQKKHVYVQVKGVDSTWVSKQISYDNSLTAYDALKIACQGTGNEVHIKNNAYGGVYVEGIGDLYEKDYGGTSGWKYKVNGTCPSVACSNYNLNEGDTLVWYYAMSMYD